MGDSLRCTKCGAIFTAHLIDGLCPECVKRISLAPKEGEVAHKPDLPPGGVEPEGLDDGNRD